MDKYKKNNKCDEIYSGGVEQYREKIIEMVKEIDNFWVLQLLIRTIIHITKEGD